MRISANQVTLARLVLLPVPMAMIYRQSLGWMLGALVIFIVLGLTDALDGMLARRYGSTPLGALLDPIVDKIFLVAAFGPIADLRIVSPAMVTVVFVRELAVTFLRSLALEESITFRTSRIAKLKATVQMAGAGFIFLFWIFRSGTPLMIVQLGAILGAALPPLIQLVRGRTPGWRAVSGWILVTFVGVLRWFLDTETTIQVLMGLILIFTVVSGVEYFWGMRAALIARFARVPADALRLLALSLVVPVGFLPVLQRDGAPIWAILAVMAVELAAGGVDNSLAQIGVSRGPWPDIVRAAFQAASAAGMVWALLSGAPAWIGHACGAAALVATGADVVGRFWRHRGHFLALTGIS